MERKLMKAETIEDINEAVGEKLSLVTECALRRLTSEQLFRMRAELTDGATNTTDFGAELVFEAVGA